MEMLRFLLIFSARHGPHPDLGALPVGALYLQSVLPAIIELDTLVDIEQSEAARLLLLRLLLPVAEHGAHLRKPRTVHSDSVILHLENHDILAECTGHPDMSAAALVLDAVVESILHKRLERQLDDLIFIEFLRNRNLIFQYIPVAELLDL